MSNLISKVWDEISPVFLKFWYVIPILILFGLYAWRGHVISNLEEEKTKLTTALAKAQEKAANNEDKAVKYDEYQKESLARQQDSEKLMEVINNAPESDSGPVSAVLRDVLNKLPR